MNSLFEWLLEPIIDKAIMAVKRMRAKRRLRRLAGKADWARRIASDPAVLRALLAHGHLLDLFLDRSYCRQLDDDPDVRRSFLQRLEDRAGAEARNAADAG